MRYLSKSTREQSYSLFFFVLVGLVMGVTPAWAQSKTTAAPVAGKPRSAILGGRASWRTAPKEYIVQPGDTLWDISRRFLGSPWYWPKLWTKNPHIQNPHWIFPGNKIRFLKGLVTIRLDDRNKKGDDTPDISKTDPNATPRGTDITIGKGLISSKALGLLGSSMIVRRESFLDKRSFASSGFISGSSNGRSLFTVRDKVYLRFKNLRNVRVGEKYSVFRKLAAIKDPVSGKLVGYMIRLYGVVRISGRQMKKRIATATITEAFQEIQKGYRVGRYIPNKVKVKIRRNESLVKGNVLRATGSTSLMAQFFQVFINRGRSHGVRAGNIFDLYRRGGPSRSRTRIQSRKNLIREKIGTAVVVDVRLKSCVALVTQSVSEIEAGDEAETSLVN